MEFPFSVRPSLVGIPEAGAGDFKRRSALRTNLTGIRKMNEVVVERSSAHVAIIRMTVRKRATRLKSGRPQRVPEHFAALGQGAGPGAASQLDRRRHGLAAGGHPRHYGRPQRCRDHACVTPRSCGDRRSLPETRDRRGERPSLWGGGELAMHATSSSPVAAPHSASPKSRSASCRAPAAPSASTGPSVSWP